MNFGTPFSYGKNEIARAIFSQSYEIQLVRRIFGNPRVLLLGASTSWKIKASEHEIRFFGKVLEHIRRMEVSLNPSSICSSHCFRIKNKRAFFSCFPKPFNEEFYFNSRTTRDFVDSFKSATQPDLFFPSENHTVCIEMKVRAQSNFDQLMKYLLLALLENERSGKQKKKFSLLFTGVGPFEKLFKEGCKNICELREQFLGYEIGEKTKTVLLSWERIESQSINSLKKSTSLI